MSIVGWASAQQKLQREAPQHPQLSSIYLLGQDPTYASYLIRWFLVVLILGMTLPLFGCSEKEDYASYIKGIKSRAANPLPPLPTLLKPSSSVSLRNDAHHSPFQPLSEKPLLHKKVVTGALEDYPVDTLKFVGTLRQEGRVYGLIMTADAKVFLVQRGQLLNNNLAMVSMIGLKKIVVTWKAKSFATGKNKIMTLKLATHG